MEKSLFSVLLVLCLCAASASVEAAVQLGSSPPSASGEIDLGRIPNRNTQVFLRIRNTAWRDAFLKDRKISPQAQVLEALFSRLRERSGNLLTSCFDPGVQDFIVARWPPEWMMGVEQQVWMIGYRMESPELTEPFQTHLVLSCFPSERLPIERKLEGFPVKTLSSPTAQIHILRGKNHILVSPNLQLLKDFLASLAQPPDPPTALPDAQIGFNLALSGLSGQQEEAYHVRHFFQQLGLDRMELALIKLPAGLEVRVALKGPQAANANRLLFQRATSLLDSIPARPDLAFVASRLNMADGQKFPSTNLPLDQPFAIGIAIPENEKTPPEDWWVRGAVANPVVLPETAAAHLRSASGVQSVKPPPGWIVKADHERIEFGTRLDGPTLPDSDPLRNHFLEIGKEALAAGVLSPRILALPVVWDMLLGPRQSGREESPFSPGWEKAVAPLEFSIAPVRDGYELRLVSASPLSHLLFFTDLLFLLQMDYSGDWDRLSSIWQQQSQRPTAGQ